MTDRQRQRQLMREAEGYLDLALAFSDRWGLADPRALTLARRALAALDRLTPSVQRRSTALILRGHALKLAQQYDEAVACLQQAADVDDENIHIYLALGWCYKRLGRLDLAIEALEQAVMVDDEEPVVFYNLACYWALANNLQMSLRYLASALDMAPSLRKQIAKESDFDGIRHEPTFRALASVSV